MHSLGVQLQGMAPQLEHFGVRTAKDILGLKPLSRSCVVRHWSD